MKKVIWIAIIVALMLDVRAMPATRTIDLYATAHPVAIDSGRLLIYYGRWNNLGTVIDSTHPARGPSPQNYDTTLVLPEEDSTFTVIYRMWFAGDSVVNRLVAEVIPYWQLDDLVGDGLDTMIITAYDTGSVAGILGAIIQIELPNGQPIAVQTTDASGDVTVGLRSGDSYVIRAFGPATKIYENTVTFTATVSGVDTVKGYTQTTSAALTADAVSVFIDVGTGIIDSATGLMTIRDRTELTLSPVLNNFGVAAGWAILPRPQTKRPDAAGRVTFIVPANSKIEPAGSYYRLTYKAFDGRSVSTGTLRTFWLDTLPDPIRWDSTLEVWE